MAFDTSGLQQWASPGELEAAAGDIASAGTDVSTTVDGLSSTWSGLSGSYQAPEQVEVLAVFTSITPHGDVVDLAAGQAKTALAAFAGTVRELEAERTALLAEVSSFEADPPTLDPADPDSPVDAAQQGWLQGDIDRLAGRYDDAVTTCVAALKGIDGTADDALTVLSGPEVGLMIAAGTNYASTHTFKRVDVIASRRVPMPWQQFRFTPLNPAGPLTAAEIAGDRYLIVDGREVHISNPRHPDHALTVAERYTHNGFANAVDWRPEVNERFYESSSAYRARVDANPGDWKPAPTSSTPRPTFGELPDRVKALKVGGGAVAVIMAGVTISAERDQAYDRLLVESPRMSEADRKARAIELGVVRGGAKTTFDVGAGMAGAAVGTMIGGPVGTVIGFGVGMGISYLADQDLPEWLGGGSVKDGFADFAENVYDGGKEALSDAGDAISEGWNSVFG
ncbi:MAG: hypothetical protein JWM61_2332 [Micrococcaceae bacterium]|nr:hypothetical protein [Micrococcaceae bacterium]